LAFDSVNVNPVEAKKTFASTSIEDYEREKVGEFG